MIRKTDAGKIDRTVGPQYKQTAGEASPLRPAVRSSCVAGLLNLTLNSKRSTC